MATLRNFGGFETKDKSELTADGSSANSSIVTTPLYAPNGADAGTSALQLAAVGSAATVSVPTFYTTTGAGATPTDNFWVMGCATRFTDITPISKPSIIAPNVNVFTWNLFFNLTPSGDLNLENASGTEIASFTGLGLQADTWYYFEVGFQVSNSAVWEVWLDGVSIGSGSGANFGTSRPVSLQFGFPANVADGTRYVDDYYCLSDASAIPTPLGPSKVYGYQGGKNSSAADTGSTLDTGTWDLAGEAPVNTAAGHLASYTTSSATGYIAFDDANAGGLGPGPSGGAYSLGNGTIEGGKWMGDYTAGSSGTGNQVMRYGKSTSVQDSGNMSLSTSAQWRAFVLDSTDAHVPTASEVFAMGFGTSGTKDVTCLEQFAFLLFTPSAVTAPAAEFMDVYTQNQAALLGY